MRITLFSVLTILFVTLVCLPVSFAQNTTPENMVRLIYFLPSDRTPQPDIDTKLDTEIKDAQLLFADLLEEHGFERKTFRFETDASGNAVVHHLNGKFAAVHYHNSPWSVWDELTEQFDLSKNIYLISIDTGILNPIPDPEGVFFVCFENGICGQGGWGNDGASGRAVVPTNDNPAVAHELGHAFGLQHDYRDPGFTGGDPMLASFCAAEWLDTNRYFNETLISSNTPTTIQMLPPLAAPRYTIRLRFEIEDPDGLHQAQLHANIPDEFLSGRQIIDCESLSGENDTAEFVTSKLSGSAATAVTKVWLQVTDIHGNFTEQEFSVDIASALPSPEVVSIPDANLAAAIRKQLGIGPGDAITQLDMLALRRRLEGSRSEIVDLTGLEHAVNLRDLNLFDNRISDLRPLAGLTQLRYLGLAYNEIHDISPLAGLTQLTALNLTHNQIRDVTPLAGLTQLENLGLEYNQIRDVSALTKLVNLKTLFVGGNPLTTIPDMALVYLLLASDEAFVIESGNFAVYSRETYNPSSGTVSGISLNSADPIRVKSLNFDKLLHGDNLTGFFERGGTIELVTQTNANFGDVVISEIMWGLNGDSTADQWIELYNTTPNAIQLDPGSWGSTWAFHFSYSNSGEWENVQSFGKVIDRVSNRDWKVPGQSGNTTQNQPLISMYRDIDYETGDVPDGTLVSSWRASTGRVNLLPPSYGTPGAEHGVVDPGAPVSQTPTDVNSDGVINVLDLVAVANGFGKDAPDVNGDGVVNIIDLVLVAGELGNAAAAPSAHSQAIEMLTTVDVQQWLRQAQQLDPTNITSQRGIIFLKHLLAVLTPQETSLLPNYPNPFNPETWIPYQLAKPSDVVILIYAADGKRVRTLKLGQQAAGVYASQSRAAYWDGKNEAGEAVASGVYFYTLKADDFTATRKMLIRK